MLELWKLVGHVGTCSGCHDEKPLVVGAAMGQANRAYCRKCARTYAVKLLTAAGPPEPATNRAFVAQEN